MKVRKIALIILSTILGITWVVLLIAQLHLLRRVFDNEKQLFQTRVEVAVFQAFEELHGTNAFRLDSLTKQPVVDSCLIDSALSHALQINRIEDTFEWGLFCPKRGRLDSILPDVDTALLRAEGFAFPLKGANDPTGFLVSSGDFYDDILYVFFPAPHRQFNWDVSMGMLLLIVLLAIVLFCFAFVIALIIRESRVVRLRSNVMNHIIHELKTPITTISLTCQLLRDHSVDKDEETVDSYLNMIDGESKALQTLVEDVLMVFRSEQLPQRELREISVHKLLHSVIDVHRLVLDECQAEVRYELQAEQDVIQGDWIHLLNAVSNLVDNAIKYRNGHLVLQLQTRNVKNSIEIRIADNGIGIADSDQKLIFEPFARVNTDNANYVKGFGMGLSYVRFVVRYHGGEIKVESELGKGATFILSLPLRTR